MIFCWVVFDLNMMLMMMMTVDVQQNCEHFGLGLGLGLATAGLDYIPGICKCVFIYKLYVIYVLWYSDGLGNAIAIVAVSKGMQAVSSSVKILQFLNRLTCILAITWLVLLLCVHTLHTYTHLLIFGSDWWEKNACQFSGRFAGERLLAWFEVLPLIVRSNSCREISHWTSSY